MSNLLFLIFVDSVATVDYDYSKAYGGAGDTSVSSAGGTFGSQTQNLSLPANAAATGAALGAMDSDSFDDTYSPRSSQGTEEIIHIFAPPGKLGVVIDTPDDGAPVVHAVKDTSVIADRICVGDKLVAVDDAQERRDEAHGPRRAAGLGNKLRQLRRRRQRRERVPPTSRQLARAARERRDGVARRAAALSSRSE